MDCKNCWVMLLVVMAACAVITSGAEPAATTTETPKTTTASPETTTPSTTTTTTTEPPTTAKPSTTTTPAAPTTVPPPIPGQSVWSVTDPVTNVTCIIANMTITAKITYPLEDSNKTSTKDVVLPASAMSEGACGASQNIKLSWDKNWLNIAFGKNDTQKLYFVNHVTLSVFADDKTFPNISSKLINTDLVLESSTEEFKTNLDQSYRCIREQTLPLSKANSSHSANLVLTKVQLQAFHSEQKVAFGAAQDCELDTPDIVPIAVGCALAALVLVVLVAYLVGRRRSQARGYVSM